VKIEAQLTADDVQKVKKNKNTNPERNPAQFMNVTSPMTGTESIGHLRSSRVTNLLLSQS
jgi:hypothetical protein